MSWLSQGLSDIGLGGVNTFWQHNKPIIEDIGIGLGAAGLAATGFGLAGIGPLAGAFGGAGAEIGGALGFGEAATTGGIDALTTGSAVGAAGAGGAIDYTGGVGAMSLGLNPSVLGGGGGGLADASGALGGFETIDASGNPITIPQGLMASATPDQAAAAGINPSSAGTALGGPSGTTMDWTPPNLVSNPDAMSASGFGAPDAAAKPSAWSLAGIGNSLTPSTALGAGIGLGGLGYNMYQGYQQQQQLKALQDSINQQSTQNQQVAQQAQAQAQPEMALGTSLQQPLTTDTLPASAQASIDQSVQAQRAQIISGYASRGMSADPNQNSALAADLANLDQQALSLKNTLETNYFNAGQQAIQSANQMIAQGLSASQISAQLPIQMQTLDSQLASATSTSIAAFAKGLTPTQTVQLQPAQQQAA